VSENRCQQSPAGEFRFGIISTLQVDYSCRRRLEAACLKVEAAQVLFKINVKADEASFLARFPSHRYQL
jgi:hypothetical protein